MPRIENLRPEPIKVDTFDKCRKLSDANIPSTKSNTSNSTSFSNLVCFSDNSSPIRKKSNMSFIFQQAEPFEMECRICLDSEEDPQIGKTLIAPCKCTGSVRNVHATCLIEWIKRNISQSELSKLSQKIIHSVDCQMCKSKLKYKVVRNKVCLSCEETKRKIQVAPWHFAVLLLLFFLMVGGSAAVVYLLVQSQNQNPNETYSLQNLFQISALVIMGISLLVCLYFIISMFFRGIDKDIVLYLCSREKTRIQKQNRNKQFTMATIHPEIPQQEGQI